MKKSYMPEIKICGITNLDDARAAMDAGADYLGFVLYKKSPRAVSPENLRRLTGKIGGKIKTVGVFVNASALVVTRIAADCGLDFVQLCGEEQQASFHALPRPVWRVIRFLEGKLQPEPSSWPLDHAPGAGQAGGPAERYVLDSFQTGLYGGSGTTMDWDAAAKISAQHKIMLAGGLTPRNVSTAVRIVRPFGLDVSSGVESRPGKKDPDKIRFFIEMAQRVCYAENVERGK